MKKITLNTNDILEYQQNKDPYLMIDYASEVIPGVSSKGYKILKETDWFFKVHWPGDPNMPGMLQVEALVQMASLSILSMPGNKGKIMYLTSADNIKLIKKVLIGDKLNLETKVISWKRGVGKFEGVAKVNTNIVSKASFGLILPDELKSFSINK